MFVPALRGEQSSELGHPNYQHPRRSPRDYSEGLDTFAALVIYVSLRALAMEPSLWRQFHTGENLILSAADYNAPRQSAVLRRLKQNADAGVQGLAAQIERCCAMTVVQVPDIETLLGPLPAPLEPVRSLATMATPTSPSASPASQSWWQTPSLPTAPTQPTQSTSPGGCPHPPDPATGGRGRRYRSRCSS